MAFEASWRYWEMRVPRLGRAGQICLVSGLAMSIACAASAGAESPGISETVIYDFEVPGSEGYVQGGNADISLVEWRNGHAVHAALRAKEHPYTSLSVSFENPVDLSAAEVSGLAMDLYNPGAQSVQFLLDVVDGKGAVHTRSAVVPAGGGGTYYVELKAPGLAIETGLRDNPADWDYDGRAFTWMWGVKQVDASAISQIKLVTVGLASDREIIIDNVRAVANPPIKANALAGVVDEFGQLVGANFPEKVTSTEDLKLRAVAELDGFTGKAMPGRSKWQGWKEGPRLMGTGFFRAEKVSDKWSLVDPDGYLYFATGIDNIRMANTSTLTGYEFRPGAIRPRDPRDTTPEDSIGMNRPPDSALPGRYLASAPRRNMFTWLPEYSDELGDHFGYVREVHSGPLASGETYSFYSANLERKYGDRGGQSYMEDWRQVTKARMVDWGFTSFGNWLDPSYYEDPKIPYFANGWIIGNFKTVSTGEDYWAPLPDPFDPVFAERARATARQVAAEVKNSPWCVGVFIDNEKSWGRTETIQQRYAIVIDTMKRDAKDSPTKAVWMRMLREKYRTIGDLNGAWGTSIKSWKELANGVVLSEHNAGKQADYAILLEAYASEYFRIVDQSLEEVLPNHMYLGSRFATWGMTPEVIRAAAKYVDVLSFNEYREIPHPQSWAFLSEYDKPAIIGEFHMGASDAALFHPGLVMASDQQDRARMYTQYMDTVIANPYFVGAHWFQYLDSPLTGRAYDGENYNVGFVTIADIPYQPMVDAAKDMNRTLYTDRFGNPEGQNEDG